MDFTNTKLLKEILRVVHIIRLVTDFEVLDK